MVDKDYSSSGRLGAEEVHMDSLAVEVDNPSVVARDDSRAVHEVHPPVLRSEP